MFNPYNYTALPTTSIEEAKNAPVDYSGNPVFYYNHALNEIYLKRFDAIGTGKIYFAKYVFEELPEEKEQKNEIGEIKAQLDELTKILKQFQNDNFVKSVRTGKAIKQVQGDIEVVKDDE